MSILIKGTEKPKGCWDCFNYDCDHWGEHGYENSTDCPLIEIVTCGECKHYKREYCRLDPFWEKDTEPTDFCSKGERRADGHTDKGH